MLDCCQPCWPSQHICFYTHKTNLLLLVIRFKKIYLETRCRKKAGTARRASKSLRQHFQVKTFLENSFHLSRISLENSVFLMLSKTFLAQNLRLLFSSLFCWMRIPESRSGGKGMLGLLSKFTFARQPRTNEINNLTSDGVRLKTNVQCNVVGSTLKICLLFFGVSRPVVCGKAKAIITPSTARAICMTPREYFWSLRKNCKKLVGKKVKIIDDSHGLDSAQLEENWWSWCE